MDMGQEPSQTMDSTAHNNVATSDEDGDTNLKGSRPVRKVPKWEKERACQL